MENPKPRLGKVRKGYRVFLPKTMYCITQWDAILEVWEIGNGMAWITDPCAVDAGMIISETEIKALIHKKHEHTDFQC